ncbi:MAG: phospholipase D family protein [Candidatus Paceibacterota bacterium]
MNSHHWANVSYLDAMRPDPSWKTEYALLASYSADLVALVAALLALAGLDDDRGSGSKVDFANAVDQLAERVRLVVQSGRLVAPAKTPRVLTILDRYVREVQLNESQASWHPKAAFAKHVQQNGEAAEWRLWIGSRNLTRDLAWDIGLTLVGRTDGEGGNIPGLIEFAESLAVHADLPSVTPRRIRSELQRVRWSEPAGCAVKSLRLFDTDTPRTLPRAPDRVDCLTVISPFLDGTTIGDLGKWGTGGTHRTLVSTRAELAKLAAQSGQPLSGFAELLYLDAPVPDQQTADDVSDRENASSQDEEPEPRNLHAKIIYARAGSRRLVWTGSANATQRGWCGPNREIVAELVVSPEVAGGLEKFATEIAKTVRLDELEAPEQPSEVEDRLEAARKQVSAAWNVTQHVTEQTPTLVAKSDPNPVDSEVQLAIGLLSGSCVVWPRDQIEVELPPITAADITELVRCRLTLSGAAISWLQRTPLNPAPTEERDRQALARYLDARTFLQWIRSLLTGNSDGEGGGDWDTPTTPGSRDNLEVMPTWWAPTLEEVLRSWSRDANSLKLIDRKVRHFLKLYQVQTDAEVRAEDRAVVEEFHRTWQILRRALVKES